MMLELPSEADIRRSAADLNLTVTDEQLTALQNMVAEALGLLRPLDELPDAPPEPRHPRSEWSYPDPAEDPLHAWYVKMSVKGADAGPLAGHGVVLKDNICLAGAPMMVGASTLQGYVADVDATVVTRILDAGGEILGKAHCEYFCFSAGSHTNATGPTHNPYRHGYSSGGSSSGCAALVGSGAVEMAIGGDQGGSIRQPSAMCGVYGMKPTHGLVPYTGVFPVDHTLDHIGPMTSSVAANALLLEVIAGEDGLDPRQRAVPRPGPYTDALNLGIEDLRIGLLTEGFDRPGGVPAVDRAVRALADRWEAVGATLSQVSVPMHEQSAVSIWAAIVIEGTAELAMRDGGIGAGHADRHALSLMRRHAQWRDRADELPEPMKASLIAAHHLRHAHHGLYYAKAQNLARMLRDAYDGAFAEVDLLLMPTIPFTAPPLPSDATAPGDAGPGFEAVANTAAFNVTGHPALSLPCGMHDGLPIGAMLVGRRWDESTIYRAAAAAESAGDWRTW
jgi:amidase